MPLPELLPLDDVDVKGHTTLTKSIIDTINKNRNILNGCCFFSSCLAYITPSANATLTFESISKFSFEFFSNIEPNF